MKSFFSGSVAVFMAVVGAVCVVHSGQSVAAEVVCIDLKKHYNAELTDILNSPTSVKDNNLAELPTGRQVFKEVPFQIGGVVQLSGKKLQEWGRDEFPEAVKKIEIGRTCTRFHMLHGAGGVFDKDGVAIGKLVLRYADKSAREINIKNGVHVRDWWGDPKQTVTGTNSVLAWTGTNPALKVYGGDNPGALRIYKTTFENPYPEKTIVSVDYVSTMEQSSPFMVGLTVE
ncbi:MAG TPA: hypothetical protein VEC99_02445 [Clostridia bacterium]|nr:hypothetical protein [Clostridia bacterium]